MAAGNRKSTTPKIKMVKVADVKLDPQNPRLGRRNTEKNLSQPDVLSIMREWTLDELAVSFIESGFWSQEALLVVEEDWGNERVLVAVEGNRRLATLKLLNDVWLKDKGPQKWRAIAATADDDRREELKEVPVLLMPDRDSVKAYLGFRHVTGIAQWRPAEKAEFIAKLLEEDGLDYEQVRKRIGSKAPTVRQNYISYRLLLQLDELDESEDDVDVDRVEERFSVLYLSIRSKGVQKYLEIDIKVPPRRHLEPVPPHKLKQLANFASWLFGTEDAEPIISDSRQIDEFGRVLEEEAAVAYLERSERPSFEVAKRMAGVADAEIAEHVELAADELEEALKAAHQHRTSKRLRRAVKRAALDVYQLLAIFPDVKDEVEKETA